jgi:hypothetical protein
MNADQQEQICECCEKTTLPVLKVNGLYCCADCNNFDDYEDCIRCDKQINLKTDIYTKYEDIDIVPDELEQDKAKFVICAECMEEDNEAGTIPCYDCGEETINEEIFCIERLGRGVCMECFKVYPEYDEIDEKFRLLHEKIKNEQK